MATHGSIIRKSDNVVIGTEDIEKIKEMQKDHGGWNPSMNECLIGPCQFLRNLGSDSVVRGPSGSVYRLNTELLIKYNSNKGQKHEIGSSVDLIQDEKEFKRFQNEHGEWNENMKNIIGKKVEIIQKFQDGDYKIKYESKTFIINPKTIKIENDGSHVPKDEKLETFKRGDFVQISDDVEKIKKLQFKHGGFIPIMTDLAGKIGKVKSILSTGDVQVKLNGIGMVFNPLLLTRIGEIQDVKVFFPGDKVRLIKNKDKVKRLQKGHGEWQSSMKFFLGKKGKVKSIFPDGDLRVKIMSQKLTLNPECVLETDSDSDSELDILKIFGQMISTNSDKSDDENENDTEMVNDQTKKFFDAVKLGNLVEVSNLIDSSLVNTCLKGVYPLMVAINEGHDEVAKLLFENKADLNARDKNRNTPLHLAVQKSRFELCDFLLKKDADINAQNRKKKTPIMIAAVAGSQDILELLTNSNNVDLNIGDSDKNTALHLAIQKSQMDSVETLLNAGADIEKLNDKKFSAFHLAALQGHEKILEILLKREGERIVDSQREDKFAAIHMIAKNNHENCLRVLLKYKADINIRNDKLQTALHVAVSRKYLNCVKILVENKAEINLKDDDGNTPLHIAMVMKEMEIIEKMGSLFGMGGFFQVMVSMKEGSDKPEDIVMYLIEHGARIDIQNNIGQTPLDLCNHESLKKKILLLVDGKCSKSHGVKTELPQTSIEDLATIPATASAPKPIISLVTESTTVTTLVNNEIQLLLPKSKDEELEELREVIQKMEDKKTCVVCLDRQINVIFGCGHMACDVCTNNLVECHICRKYIENKIRIFE